MPGSHSYRLRKYSVTRLPSTGLLSVK